MPTFEQQDLSPSMLLLDPNNYRFQGGDNFTFAAKDRIHESGVQNRAQQRLRSDEGLLDLKNSIMRNGYVPIERLVVCPYEHAESRWLVIEGNRRLAAVRWVMDDNEAGIPVTPEVLRSIEKLPVVITRYDNDNEAFVAALMGIRHVSGIKEWGGYQRAKLIADMRDSLGLETAEVAERLGLSAQEVNRRYRAFRALSQMKESEDYGSYAKPSLYPLFHEAISIPPVREWLGWDEKTTQFTDEGGRLVFYSLVAPTVGDERDTREPKITSYAQIRELRNILPRPEARRALLDPARPFSEASAIAAREEMSGAWRTDVTAATRSLTSMAIDQLKNLSTEDVALLNDLQSKVSERINDHKNLMGGRNLGT